MEYNLHCPLFGTRPQFWQVSSCSVPNSMYLSHLNVAFEKSFEMEPFYWSGKRRAMNFILEVSNLSIITMNFITFPFLNALNESRRKNGLWLIFGESCSSEKSLPSLGTAVPLAPDWNNKAKKFFIHSISFMLQASCERAGWVRATKRRLKVNILPFTYVRESALRRGLRKHVEMSLRKLLSEDFFSLFIEKYLWR